MYFDTNHGFVSNILYCDPTWQRHSNFLIVELLDFLVSRRKQLSTIGPQGYFSVRELIDHVGRMGFTPTDALSALVYMLRQNLITADHMGRSSLSATDFVRAHASGFVHMRLLLENIHYVSGIAPATFLLDRKTSEQIARLATINPGFADTRFSNKQEIVFLLSNYLKDEYSRHAKESPLFANQAIGARFALRMVDNCLNRGSPVLGAHLDPTLL